MKKSFKRLTSILLSIILTMTCVPLVASSSTNEYLVATDEDWEQLSDEMETLLSVMSYYDYENVDSYSKIMPSTLTDFVYWYYYKKDVEYKSGNDPLGYFKYSEYCVFDADEIDWLVSNVFNQSPNHNLNTFDRYYYNGNYYAAFYGSGVPFIEVSVKDYKRKSDSSYIIKVEEKFIPEHEEAAPTYNDVYIDACLKNIDGKRVWSYFYIGPEKTIQNIYTSISDIYYSEYAIYDIDFDGTTELIVFDEENYDHIVYTYKNGQAKKIGAFFWNGGSVNKITNRNGIYRYTRVGNERIVDLVEIKNGQLSITNMDGIPSNIGEPLEFYPFYELSYFDLCTVAPKDEYKCELENESVSIFAEKSYIADIWLNRHPLVADTNESQILKTIFDLESVSTDIYKGLANDPNFNAALVLWYGLKTVFSPTETTKEIISLDEIYETLILDLLRKVMNDRIDEYNCLINDAVASNSNNALSIFTEYKGYVDGLTRFADKKALTELEIVRNCKYESELYNEFIDFLLDKNIDIEKWKNNEFLDGVSSIADIASGTADFLNRFSGYCLALNMSEEMLSLLKEMKKNTSDISFQYALGNVINAFNNTDFVAVICSLKTIEDVSMNVIDGIFKDLTSQIPTYSLLCKLYETEIAFANLVYNTSGIIDSYFLCEATYKFIESNKKAIENLANKYITSNKEADAAAYIFAVRTYKKVIAVDLETTMNFISNANREGLHNIQMNNRKSVISFILGKDWESTYDTCLKHQNDILKMLDYMFWDLDNSWKYDDNYLEKDYPDIYKIYMTNEYEDRIYAPEILDAYIGTDGKTYINWILPYSFNAENSSGKEMPYPLYGAFEIDGVRLEETTGNQTTSSWYSLTNVASVLTSYNSNTFKDFPKTYYLSGYTRTSSENVYTPKNDYLLQNPIMKVELGHPTQKDPNGKSFFYGDDVSFVIKDNTDSMYEVKYNIYRKTNSSSWTYLETISRNKNGTVYTDTNVVDGNKYYYKVSAYAEFDNGKTLSSEMSDVISYSMGNKDKSPLNTNITVVNPLKMNYPRLSRVSTQSVSTNELPYVKLEWEKVEGADFYEIHRISNISSAYTLVDTVNSNVFTYSDYSADNGLEYSYRIVAVSSNEGGENICEIISVSETTVNYYLGDVYSVLWIAGENRNLVPYLEGMNISVPKPISNDEVVFIGWSPDVPSIMPSSDLVFNAVYLNKDNFEIRTPTVTTISYGDSIILHADIANMPQGATVQWFADNNNFEMVTSNDGLTCKIMPKTSGDTMFAIKLISADGDILAEDTQIMMAKAGFFYKIIAFFKMIFGLTKTIMQSI